MPRMFEMAENLTILVGHLGDDAKIHTFDNGRRVANLSIATNHNYVDRDSGEIIEKATWHRVTTFQDGLIPVLEKHAKKGRMVYVRGELHNRTSKAEDGSIRYHTEILLTPGGKILFMDKMHNAGAQPAANGTARAEVNGAGTPIAMNGAQPSDPAVLEHTA